MVQALRTAQINTGPNPTKSTLSAAPDEPVFIPTGIVKADTESLDVQSESSEDGGGLDTAASALKALRKRKPKK